MEEGLWGRSILVYVVLAYCCAETALASAELDQRASSNSHVCEHDLRLREAAGTWLHEQVLQVRETRMC